MENVVCDEESRRVDYADSAITENTRAAYPIDYIPKRGDPLYRSPSSRHHLPHLRCLRCAATGQPPDARPSHVSLYERVHGQGRRHRDGRSPSQRPRFRRALARPSWSGNPNKYARPASRQDLHPQHPSLAGQYGAGQVGRTAVGTRLSLQHTRAIISAIHAGALADAPVEQDPHFGFDAICACPGVPSAQMVPRRTWADGTAYDERAGQLAELFKANFAAFEGEASPAVKRAGPTSESNDSSLIRKKPMEIAVQNNVDLDIDYKVADLSLAEWGRQEIILAEQEMPGLMALRAEYGHAQPLAACADCRLFAHDDPDRCTDRDAHCARGASALVLVQHLLDPRPRGCRPRGYRHTDLRLEGRNRGRVLCGVPSKPCTGPTASAPT